MNLSVNGRTLSVKPGQTILAVLKDHGFKIPTLCDHPDLVNKATCRVCVVEVKGEKHLLTACSTLAREAMVILTNSPRVQKARRLNLELLFAEHAEKCTSCSLIYDCELLRLAKEYKIKINRFSDRKSRRKTYRFANAVEIDGSQCIDCQNCLAVCRDLQAIDYLRLVGTGSDQEVKPRREVGAACVYCGQCVLHCPVAAAQEQAQWPAVEKLLKEKKLVALAQLAPAVRVSLGEEFGLPPGEDATGKCYTALKKLGFQHVFDINFGADITTLTEAEELVRRLKDKKAVFPLTTSCCPSWVAYAEFYHPELLPHLTTARSPHMHLAGAIKSYWAKKQGLNSRRLAVVSIVPCTAKKYEAGRPELKYKGRPLVDYVLTTRELAYLLKKRKIDFKSLPDTAGEKLFNAGSGAAAIYGASGGVMESALRTAAYLLAKEGKGGQGKKKKQTAISLPLEFKAVRGLSGLKEATVKLAGRRLKLGVVNGLGQLKKIRLRFKDYHYLEVMACPGGCLGGGGQPPTTAAIRRQRAAGLYAIDAKKTVRRAHENEAMMSYYNWVKKKGLAKKLLLTKYKGRSAPGVTMVSKVPRPVFSFFRERR